MKLIHWFFVFLVAILLSQIDPSNLPSMRAAFADPPPWAPAYGYRRKHHEDDDDRDDHHHHHRDFDDEHRQWQQRVHEVVINRFEEVFRRLDINHDGRISRGEWTDSLSLFDRLDRNHDGVLTRDEYEHVDEQRGFVSTLIDTIKDKVASLWARLW